MLSYDSLCERYDFIAPINLVLKLRVSLFARMATKGPPWLLPMLALGERAPRSWFKAAQADLLRLASQTEPFNFMISKPMHDWVSLVRSCPNPKVA